MYVLVSHVRRSLILRAPDLMATAATDRRPSAQVDGRGRHRTNPRALYRDSRPTCQYTDSRRQGRPRPAGHSRRETSQSHALGSGTCQGRPSEQAHRGACCQQVLAQPALRLHGRWAQGRPRRVRSGGHTCCCQPRTCPDASVEPRPRRREAHCGAGSGDCHSDPRNGGSRERCRVPAPAFDARGRSRTSACRRASRPGRHPCRRTCH